MPKDRKNTKVSKRATKVAASGANRSANVSLKSALGAVGNSIGRSVGNFISKVTGSGAYSINRNTLVTSSAPVIMGKSDVSSRIRHSEMFTPVNSSISFTLTSILINPGNVTLFPWLSGVANNFETYKFHGLIIYYEVLSGTAISSTSAAMGDVTLSTNYDVLNPNFTSTADMQAYHFTTAEVPYKVQVHPVECDPRKVVNEHLYITNVNSIGSLPADDDPRFHYLGNFQFATEGQQDSGHKIGKLWVAYDVELFTPKKPQTVLAPIPSPNFVSAQWDSVVKSGDSFIRTANLLGPVASHGDMAGLVLPTSLVDGNISFHPPYPGSYLMQIGTCIQSQLGDFYNVLDYTGASPSSGLNGFNIFPSSVPLGYNTINTMNNTFIVSSIDDHFCSTVCFTASTSSEVYIAGYFTLSDSATEDAPVNLYITLCYLGNPTFERPLTHDDVNKTIRSIRATNTRSIELSGRSKDDVKRDVKARLTSIKNAKEIYISTNSSSSSSSSSSSTQIPIAGSSTCVQSDYSSSASSDTLPTRPNILRRQSRLTDEELIIISKITAEQSKSK